MASVQAAKNIAKGADETDEKKKLTELVNICGGFQIAMAIGTAAGSCPVFSGPELVLQRGAYILSWSDIVKSIILVGVSDKSIVYEFVGMYEMSESLVFLLCYLGILTIQMIDDNNSQKAADFFNFWPNLFSDIGLALGGVGKVIPDTNPGAKDGFLLASGVLYLLAGGLDGVALTVDFASGFAYDI